MTAKRALKRPWISNGHAGNAQPARAEQLLAQTGKAPQVFSMASWKQRQFNERLLDVFIEKLALEPSWVKKHPSYDELRSYGAIAA